mmetsp:Transcript_9076/g.24659  ORF Transcript_9076/g.24659 Transcript_9076/m.24659 type:complete len:423 (-) Transcript_9076:2387-3655(-)
MGTRDWQDEEHLLLAINRALPPENIKKRKEMEYFVPMSPSLYEKDVTLSYTSFPPLLSIRKFINASLDVQKRMHAAVAKARQTASATADAIGNGEGRGVEGEGEGLRRDERGHPGQASCVLNLEKMFGASQHDQVEALVRRRLLEAGHREEAESRQKRKEEAKQKGSPTARRFTQLPHSTPNGEDLERREEADSVGSNEVILAVSLYCPRREVKMHEHLVLGSQKLTELRDKLYCLSDNTGEGEKSTSGMFLIEGVAYDDMREQEGRPTPIAYSTVVRNWMEERAKRRRADGERFEAPVTTQRMENTTFADLNIRLGYPYLYLHHGRCEHKFIFTELRMIGEEDSHHRSHYPLLKVVERIRRQKCSACNIFFAKRVVYDDILSESSPCLYCFDCFTSFFQPGKDKEVDRLRQGMRVYEYYHD